MSLGMHVHLVYIGRERDRWDPRAELSLTDYGTNAAPISSSGGFLSNLSESFRHEWGHTHTLLLFLLPRFPFSLYIYIYIYICAYMCACVCVCVCLYVCIVCEYVCMYACTFVCMYARMCEGTYKYL